MAFCGHFDHLSVSSLWKRPCAVRKSQQCVICAFAISVIGCWKLMLFILFLFLFLCYTGMECAKIDAEFRCSSNILVRIFMAASVICKWLTFLLILKNWVPPCSVLIKWNLKFKGEFLNYSGPLLHHQIKIFSPYCGCLYSRQLR